MSQPKPKSVELHQGNPTVARLMRRALGKAGFEVVDEPGDDELSELLVVDVDSGLEPLDERLDMYRQADCPVLVCGVRASRDVNVDADWLERPFVPNSLVAQCRALIAERHSAERHSAERHSAEKHSAEKHPVEDPIVEPGDGPTEDDEAGGLRDTDNLSPDEEPEFLDLDSSGSIELDVEDLEDVGEGFGGSIQGIVEREQLGEEELEWDEPPRDAPERLRNPSLNQTMPDAPAAMAPDGLFDEPSDQTVSEVSSSGSAPSRGSALQLPPELERAIEGAAKLLAQSWSRIGLAARSRDRADHIQRVLRAVFDGGVSAATAQIDRIPGADGFSGDLAVMSLVELLGVVRMLELRGRLEVSTADDDFVLYVDGGELEDIENLSGSDDRRLLEMLLEMGSIPTDLFDELAASLNSELATPLQMLLRQDGLVSSAEIKRARRHHARRLFEQLSGANRGRFAFMEVQEGTGHAWPVDALALDLRALLGEPARQDSKPEAAAPANTGSRNTQAPPGLEVDDMPATVEVPEADPD